MEFLIITAAVLTANLLSSIVLTAYVTRQQSKSRASNKNAAAMLDAIEAEWQQERASGRTDG